MHKIDAILFDKDGTLFDYHKTWANWSRTFLLDLAAGNAALARDLGHAVGFEFDYNAFRGESLIVTRTPPEIAEALLPLLPGASMAGILTRMARLSAEVPQAEATPLLPLMLELGSRGLKLGIATNDLMGATTAHLEEAGIAAVFDGVIACDSGYAPKPAPDMLYAFSELTGVDPARTLMVGDSVHDMTAARSAGMRRVAVLTGAADRNLLDPHAEAVLPSIARLPKWLDCHVEGRDAA